MSKLSGRLSAIAELIPEGRRIIDVGTDHAHIPIELVRSGKVPSAAAVDIKRGPLSIAEDNIKKAGLSDRIDTVLSDGLSAVPVEGGETIVITGVGADTIMGILRESPEKAAAAGALILGPHKNADKLRDFLSENGFAIVEDLYMEEKGKHYVLMKVVRGDLI